MTGTYLRATALAAAASLAFALASSAVFARVLRVPQQYQTINNAIRPEVTQNGDTILIAPGIYAENVNIEGNRDEVTIASYFIIDGNSNYIDSTVIYYFRNVDIERVSLIGFTIHNGWYDEYGISTGGITIRSCSPYISHCKIINNYKYPSGGGGIYLEDSNAIIEHCLIANNHAEWGGGIGTNHGSPEFNFCVIANNTADYYGGGVGLNHDSPVFRNCLIYGNDASRYYGDGIMIFDEATHPILINTIVWGNNNDQIAFIPTNAQNGITISFSCIQGGQNAIVNRNYGNIVWNEGNIDTNPLFVNAQTGDFHLTANSPCIDAGDPASPRDPDSTRADVGAYYFHQNLTPDIAITPDSLDFGSLPVGRTTTDTLTISNTGDADLTVSNITTSGAPFSVQFDGEFTLQPGESRDIAVTFAPQAEGEFNGTLTIASNDPDESELVVQLTGDGFHISLLNVPDDYQTIQAAIDAAQNGDTIRVAHGTYRENINFNGKNLKLIGDPAHPDSVVIDGNQNGSVVSFLSGETRDAVLSGFRIQNGTGTMYNYRHGGGIVFDTSSATISHCIICNNSVDGGGGGILVNCQTVIGRFSNPLIENCVIKNNDGGIWGGGIYAAQGAFMDLIGCVVENNQANNGGGLALMRVVDGRQNIVNCTISGNRAVAGGEAGGSRGGGMLLRYGVQVSVSNTISYGNSPHEIQFWPNDQRNNLTISNSDIQGGEDGIVRNNNGDVTWGAGNISSDPLFRDSENGDFHLTVNSPCVDAGIAFYVAGGDTIVNISEDEYNGFAPDMGAFESPYLNSRSLRRVPYEYGTIQSAINSSSDGDTVLVAHGIYRENINFNGKNIKLIGDPEQPDSVVIDGGGNGSVVSFFNGETREALVSGFRIQNGTGTMYNYRHGGGLVFDTSSATISHCIICNNSVDGGGGGIFVNNATIINRNHISNPLIQDCIIRNNAGGFWGGGIYIAQYASATIERCLITGNTANNGGGLTFATRASGQVINCTISGNLSNEDGGCILVRDGSRFSMVNTVLWDNSPPTIYLYRNEPENQVTISYCDIEGGRQGIELNGHRIESIIWAQGNISSDPLFLDPDNGDFHLTANSPCIDAGDPASPRDPDSTRADMGAYYFEHEPVPAHIIVESDSIKYGCVAVDSQIPDTLTITNDGDFTLIISNLEISGEFFSVEFVGEFAVAPGASREVVVTFSPQEVGNFAGTLTINSNDPDNQVLEIELAGNGIGSIDTPDNAEALDLQGNCLFLAHYQGVGSNNKHIDPIDVSNPAHPVLLNRFYTASNDKDLVVRGNYGYVAEESYGLRIINISNPTDIQTVARIDGTAPGQQWPNMVSAVGLQDTLLYFTNYYDRFYIYNVRYPERPSLLGSCGMPRTVDRLYVDGEWVYLANHHNGVTIIDVSNPRQPSIVTTYDTPGFARDVMAIGNTLYVADWDNGLLILDISDRSNPQLIGHCDTPGNVEGLWATEDYVYLADWNTGLLVVDVRDPAHPALVAVFDTPGNAQDVKVRGNYAYLADAQWDVRPVSGGLRIIDVSQFTSGAPPEIWLFSPLIDFGATSEGQSLTGSLTISNEGYSNLIVSNITTSGAPFTVEFGGEFTLQPGETNEIDVTFTPERGGQIYGELIISSNDPDDSELVVQLTGDGFYISLLNVPDDYQTIQAAIDAAQNGDTILVAPGTYEENLVIAKNITLASMAVTTSDFIYVGQTILDGQHQLPVVTIGNCTAKVAGFTIRNGVGVNGYNGSYGGGVYGQNAEFTLEYNVIVDNAANSGGAFRQSLRQ